MQIIIVFLTITTIMGWAAALWLARRTTKFSKSTVATQNEPAVDLTSLTMHLARKVKAEEVFQAAGEWLCDAGNFALIIFYAYDHASHERSECGLPGVCCIHPN